MVFFSFGLFVGDWVKKGVRARTCLRSVFVSLRLPAACMRTRGGRGAEEEGPRFEAGEKTTA